MGRYRALLHRRGCHPAARTVQEEYTLARRGAERLWNALQTKKFTRGLGALTGNQAVQMVKGGLEAVYLSG